jgi:hypothetical protein
MPEVLELLDFREMRDFLVKPDFLEFELLRPVPEKELERLLSD